MEDVNAIDKADANTLLWKDEIREKMAKRKGSTRMKEVIMDSLASSKSLDM